MEKKNGIQWRELFVNKTFDLVMLIVGISIAFQLENWKTDSDQRSREKFYNESLIADIDADIAELNDILTELENDRDAVDHYLLEGDKLPADSLMVPLQAILTFETFTGNQNTYQTLLSIGLNTFSDRDIIKNLTGYYSSYTAIRRLESVYTTAIFEIHKHFSDYVIYDTGAIVNKSVTTMPATRNSLIVARGQLDDGVQDYTDALFRARELKTALEKSR